MNTNRLDKLIQLLDKIDEEIGIGPSEEIIDETKVDVYISNFINEFKQYKVFDMLYSLNENTNKSLLEELNEI